MRTWKVPDVAIQLPQRFDPERLRADLSRVGETDWHAMTGRTWHPGRRIAHLVRWPEYDPEVPPILGRCPYFREVIGSFTPTVRRVRLSLLRPKGEIPPHVDDVMAVRVHVPIIGRAVMTICGVPVPPMEPGEAWLLDTERTHMVQNLGVVDRVHMVLELYWDDWLRAQVA